jgi:hypothetical protein
MLLDSMPYLMKQQQRPMGAGQGGQHQGGPRGYQGKPQGSQGMRPNNRGYGSNGPVPNRGGPPMHGGPM